MPRKTDPVTIRELLRQGRSALADRSDSARLDAEVLLEHVLGAPRVVFYTRNADPVATGASERFLRLVEQRRRGRPVAQLVGQREFWSMTLTVTSDTLIPRPETELLVERGLVRIQAQTTARVLELGTGCGAIALAIATERPAAVVTATDISEAALEVAEGNAQRLNMDEIRWLTGAWFEPLRGTRFDIILSNPPYVGKDPNERPGPEVAYEPSVALFAGPDGLDAIRLIIGQANAHLRADGWLLLEHAADQAEAVRSLLAERGFGSIGTYRDLAGHQRVTEACWNQGTWNSVNRGEPDSDD